MMKFNPKKVCFGRHETFSLRYSWLTKGFQAIQQDPEVFSSDEATVILGVGKNMVHAIRYWLLACRIIVPMETKGFQPSLLGNAIFDKNGYDPYLEDEATLWLVHWLIATNSERSTAWYWFFNQYHKPEFSSQEVSSAMLEFAAQHGLKTAVTTIKSDAAILLRMYARSKGGKRTPLEDALDSPLSQLKLISQTSKGHSYRSHQAERGNLPISVFGYAIAELFELLAVREFPIGDLMYSKFGYPSPGAVFRLTENALITKLEKLVQKMPGIFEIRETAGIHQVYLLEAIKPEEFLKLHYRIHSKAAA